MNLSEWLATVRRWPQAALLSLVRGYRLLLSPWLGSSCRFTPTCSAYALDALALHGAVGGSYLTVARLVRCHPWCDGGLDEVPTQLCAPALFSSLLDTKAPPSADLPSPSPVSKTLL